MCKLPNGLRPPFHDSEVCSNNMEGSGCKWTSACLINRLSLTLVFQDGAQEVPSVALGLPAHNYW